MEDEARAWFTKLENGDQEADDKENLELLLYGQKIQQGLVQKEEREISHYVLTEVDSLLNVGPQAQLGTAFNPTDDVRISVL